MTKRSTFTSCLRFLATAILIAVVLIPATGQEADADRPVIPGFYHKPKNRPLRGILTRVHFGFSTGYQHTFYSHNLQGYGIIQQDEPYLFPSNASGGTLSPAFGNWFNQLDSVAPILVEGSNFLVNSDTARIVYRGDGLSIPINLSMFVKIKNRYRVGAGYIFEYHRPGTLRPVQFEEELGHLDPEVGGTFFRKYFLYLGGDVYRYWDYTVAVDFYVGGTNFGRKFERDRISGGTFFSLGLSLERNFSEFFTGFIRPSIGYSRFNLGMGDNNPAIRHNMPVMGVQFGGFWRIPDLPKCKIKTCHTQVNHMHGEYDWRSRRHPFYKKQNPHYGENYKKLIKYKGKNKKKLNPY